MSAVRRVSLIPILMTCAVLATTASAARAQMGGDVIPAALAPAPSSDMAPASVTPVSSLDAFRLGMPLQLSASLTAYRWFEMTMGQIGIRPMPAVNRAAQVAPRSAWWRKRS